MLQFQSVSVYVRILCLLLFAGLLALLRGLIYGDVDLTDKTDGYMLGLQEATAMDGIIWVDARSEEAYRIEHLAMAIHLSEDEWDIGLNEILNIWDFEQPIVVYCDGGDCVSSKAFAKRLRQDIGSEEVYWLQGGWQVLQEAVAQ